MKRCFFALISFFLTVGGLVFLPSCSNNLNIPSTPLGLTSTFTSTPTNTTGTLTPTPTATSTSTSTGSVTNTATPTFTSTGTSTFTPTSTSTGSATYTPTPTWTLTGSPTPTVTSTLTGSPTWTSTPQVCVPVAIGIRPGIIGMLYGQSQLYVIRTHADWDTYLGTTGATAPVDFSAQMLLVENWGTEYCPPGVNQASQGRVVEYNMTSACVLSDHIEVTITRGSSCTCGGSCVYTMAPNQVNAVVLPASSLPVSVN